MKPNYDSYSISANSIIVDSLKIGLLIFVVKLRSQKINLYSIYRKDTKEVNTNTSKLINSFSSNSRLIVYLKNRTILIAKGFIEGLLVSNYRSINIGILEVLVIRSFNLKLVT